jgi:myo-inositol 2-dehydrogenase/D-chiro-inositol 1-dehydrogenase
MTSRPPRGPRPSRRQFLKSSAAVASASALAGLVVPHTAHAQGSDVIKIGMIGCGGRCTGAAVNAMTADPGTRLVAMCDLLLERVQEKRQGLRNQFKDRVQVDDEHCFAGFDGYQKVVESADVVLIANAAKFHPLHLMSAIQAGKHVFVEKPHAIDPAGCKMVSAACELAKQKKLSVVSGLHSRHHPGYQETIKRVHDGAIGDIVAAEINFLREPYGLYRRKPGWSEVQYQCGNQYHFTWLSGDDVVQSLVHNIDRTSWALREAVPVKAHGLGGRSTSVGEVYGNVFDHHSVVYQFANGVRMYAFCRTIDRCYNEYSDILLGSKGQCSIMACRITGENQWQYQAPPNAPFGGNPYDLEHDTLFKAIRAGNPVNHGDYMARSTLVGVMGQMTCYTGKEITWDRINKSDFCYLPKPEDCKLDMEPPVKPDEKGIYPVYTPGVTQLL